MYGKQGLNFDPCVTVCSLSLEPLLLNRNVKTFLNQCFLIAESNVPEGGIPPSASLMWLKESVGGFSFSLLAELKQDLI